MNLINQNSITNYWWDCPSCGQTKNDSLVKDESGEILGSQLTCPECFWVRTGEEHTYVDEDVYEVPEELVPQLEKHYWKCQACGGFNEQPDTSTNLTLDDLYCNHCETWQSDIPELPQIQENYKSQRYQESVESKNRFENPVTPIEYRKFEEKVNKYTKSFESSNPTNSFSLPKKTIAITLAGILSITSLGLWIHDGTQIRTIHSRIENPRAQTQVKVYEYRIVTKSGWNPDTSAREFKLINSETRQNGTRQVPDGFETYYETETYISSYRTESYTDTVYDRVQTSTRQQCSTNISGGIARNSCSTVPVYSSVPRSVTRTRQIPVTATRQVPKQRQKWRTEPTYATWYTWSQGEDVLIATPTSYSENFQIPQPDLSQYQNSPNITLDNPESKCSVRVESKERSIDCQTYITLNKDKTATVTYSKWSGIKSVEF